MSKNNQQSTTIRTTMTSDDDIYIDCRPVDIKNEEITSSSYNEDGIDYQVNSEILDSISNAEFNIYDNIGFQSLLAVGLFTFMLVAGNYVFYTLPNSRLEKAVYKNMYN